MNALAARHLRKPSASPVKQFRDDPHVAGQRSNYLENQGLTPTGRPAALFTERERGYNGYYLWFSTIPVQAADPYSDVVANEWKAPFSLYFEAKEAGRPKFQLQLPRGRWLKVLTGDLVAGTLTDGPTDYWIKKGYVVAPSHMVRHRVTALGDRWYGFEVLFDWGAFPPEWLVGDREKIFHGFFLGYWWLTNDEGRWDHVGEAGKGFYLTRPEIKHLPVLDTVFAG